MEYTFPPNPRSTLQRKAGRGTYAKAPIFAIIDEALVCHLGFVQDGQPFVIPTLHVRIGETLYFHGAPEGRLMQVLQSGAEVCAEFTLLDGLVMAKSVCSHSLNYRSVVLFGRGQGVIDPAEKQAVFEALTERLQPGRWQEARHPSARELEMIAVAALPIEQASAKTRSGPPVDSAVDRELPVWTGVIPIRQVRFEPQDSGA
jgi:hypothetical protein